MKEVDDLLLQNSTQEGHAEDLKGVLTRCREHNITISKKKVALTTRKTTFELPFAGFIIGRDGFKQDFSHTAKPFRQLLRNGVAYTWLDIR